MKSGFLRAPPSVWISRANTPLLFPDSCTCPAMALESMFERFHVCIPFIIRMSVWAMGLVNIAVSTGKILATCDGFKMARIHTQTILAQMVKIHTIGDTATRQLVRETVSQDFASLASRIINGQLPISKPRPSILVQTCSCPNQARPQVRSVHRNRTTNRFFLQSLAQRFWKYPFFPVRQMSNHLCTSSKFA